MLDNPLVLLSKKGILEDGVFLTESGSEWMKKVKIKPPSANRKTNRKLNPVGFEIETERYFKKF